MSQYLYFFTNDSSCVSLNMMPEYASTDKISLISAGEWRWAVAFLWRKCANIKYGYYYFYHYLSLLVQNMLNPPVASLICMSWNACCKLNTGIYILLSYSNWARSDLQFCFVIIFCDCTFSLQMSCSEVVSH